MTNKQEFYNIVEKELSDMQMGYELVDLKYYKRGTEWILQVFADKEGGINITDCENISRKLDYEFERHPELGGSLYCIEVSSPGLERQLKSEKDFNKAAGKPVKVKFYSFFENNKVWEGTILKAENGKLYFIDEKGVERVVNIENIADAKLEVKI